MQELFTTLWSLVNWISLEYLAEIFVIFLVIYAFLRFMEGTRGEGILKGIALLMLTFPILLAIVAERLNIMDRLLVIIRFLIKYIVKNIFCVPVKLTLSEENHGISPRIH